MDLGARREEHEIDHGVQDNELVGLDDEDEAEDEEEVEDEDDDEDLEDEEALASPSQTTPLPNLDPPPPYLREISTLASWTVSSSKPGCSISQLRHPNTNLFWQSDGPQPHYLNIHFFKLVRIVGLRLYLDFDQDESYTPTRIIFLAGSGMNDLQEWGEMRLESPRGWVWADFSGVGDVDSEGDDDNDDNADADEQNTTTRQRMLTHTSPLPNGDAGAGGPIPPNDAASSDSENAAPFTRPQTHSQFHTPVQTQTPLPNHHHHRHNHNHNHNHHTPLPTSSFDTNHTQHFTSTPYNHPTSTPSLSHHNNHHHYPRAPFTSLSPAHPSHPYPRRAPPPRRPRAPKMPTLRAHLLQIKILENHQNGKDTHLRGLQVFAKNDEELSASSSSAAAATGGRAGGAVKEVREKHAIVDTDATAGDGDVLVRKRDKAARRQREERLELGSGVGAIGRSAWDVHGGDLR
jgi:anaphase-promoting complex subunit 10